MNPDRTERAVAIALRAFFGTVGFFFYLVGTVWEVARDRRKRP